MICKRKVFLFGDSIRIGYCEGVRRRLSDVADVLYPWENCQFIEYSLRHLHDWKVGLGLGPEVAVVHWNSGLWDTAHIDGDPENLTPPDAYANMIRRTHCHIANYFPDAVEIFALSTPVVEEKIPEWLRRSNAEICRYNEIAMETLAPFGVQFNDLYHFSMEHLQNLYSDYVHYVPSGFDLLADQVAKYIRPLLNC